MNLDSDGTSLYAELHTSYPHAPIYEFTWHLTLPLSSFLHVNLTYEITVAEELPEPGMLSYCKHGFILSSTVTCGTKRALKLSERWC